MLEVEPLQDRKIRLGKLHQCLDLAVIHFYDFDVLDGIHLRNLLEFYIFGPEGRELLEVGLIDVGNIVYFSIVDEKVVQIGHIKNWKTALYVVVAETGYLQLMHS